MLETMKPMLVKARKEGYAVIAANIFDDATARAAIKAAEIKKSPIILNIGANANPDVYIFSWMVNAMAQEASVPVAINLDHGPEYEVCIKAANAGFSSIMTDRSMLPFEDNVREVAEIVKVCHALGKPVEAELGHVGVGANYDVDRDAALTQPEVAAEFVERTDCDFLAVAIGTAHGPYHGFTPYLDFDRLEAIAKVVSIPLVLHGGSGTGEENLAKAAKMGIAKINIGTDLIENGYKYLFEGYDGETDRGLCSNRALKRLAPFYAGYQDKIMHYMDVFGSTGKAE